MISRALLLASLVVLSGCAPMLQQLPDDGTYAKLVDALPQPGWKGLQGRLIVIDPGHGGKDTGAIGPGGLREKDINLGVSLQLAALLREAGAEVILTRSEDRALSDSGSGGSELAERIRIANERNADLFLSVHHNATLNPHSKLDETQTYYKMDDSGPSYDVASCIHRRLARNLGLPQEKLVPGNYFVLRNSHVPAVLGEASYVTNPVTERKLALGEKQRLEAEAYFLGIAEYFSRGVPRVTNLRAGGPVASRPLIQASVDSDGVAIDPNSVRMQLNGLPVKPFYDADYGTLSFQPASPLGNGTHLVSVQVRNVRGNSSRTTQLALKVDNPAHRVEVELPFAKPPKDGPMPILARVVDRHGLPVADGTPVSWKSTSGRFEKPVSTTRGGRAANYLGEVKASGAVDVTVSVAKVHGKVRVPASQADVLMGKVEDADGKAIAGALVVALGQDNPLAVTNEDGYWWIDPAPKGLAELRVQHPGYRTLAFGLRRAAFLDLQLSPIEATRGLMGQVIVLNPEGGADERATTARSDERGAAASMNWQVADYLKAYLESAGAKVVMTRSLDEAPGEIARVRLANRIGATLLLTIGRRGSELRTEHYPSSTAGKRIAERVRKALHRHAGTSEGRTVANSSYVLIQSACPSVTVLPGTVPDPANVASQARREAYGIFLGLSEESERSGRLQVTLRYSDGTPASDAITTLDSRWQGQTSMEGSWTFGNLEAGDHHLSVSDGRFVRSFWVVGLAAGEDRRLEIVLDRPEVPDDLAINR